MKVNTYCQQLIASDIASDIALLATIQFFSHTLFLLATFWRGGGREEAEIESAGNGEEGEKESTGDGEGG